MLNLEPCCQDDEVHSFHRVLAAFGPGLDKAVRFGGLGYCMCSEPKAGSGMTGAGDLGKFLKGN